MKAIIEVDRKGSAVRAARKQLTSSRRGQVPDFRLSFESARSLFTELTPARLDLLDTLRSVGPCKGQITIPRRICTAAGIGPGSKVSFSRICRGCLELTRSHETRSAVYARKR